jgi:hypothetical protein
MAMMGPGARARRWPGAGRAAAAGAWLALLGLGCGDGEAGAPFADATPVGGDTEEPPGRRLDAPIDAPVTVEIGDAGPPFSRLADGATLFLERGSQGLQHIYFSVSAELPPGFYTVTHAFSASADPAPPYLLGPTELSVPFTADDRGAGTTAFGILSVIPVPEPLIAEGALHLHVRVDTRGGAEAGVSSRAIRIAWP